MVFDIGCYGGMVEGVWWVVGVVWVFGKVEDGCGYGVLIGF